MKTIAEKIIQKLENRGGFDDWWHRVDEEDKEEIQKEINREIFENLAVSDILQEMPQPPEGFKFDDMGASVFRTHDDCDGDRSKGIRVSMSIDGDMWISTTTDFMESARFRDSFFGGGGSDATWKALRLLMYAIWLDNKNN